MGFTKERGSHTPWKAWKIIDQVSSPGKQMKMRKKVKCPGNEKRHSSTLLLASSAPHVMLPASQISGFVLRAVLQPSV